MSPHFLLLIFLLFIAGELSAKSIEREESYEETKVPKETEATEAPEEATEETKVPEETEEPEETDVTEEPKPYDWKNIYKKCLAKFNNHPKCCEVSGGGKECLQKEGDTTEADETTTPAKEEEDPQYSDPKLKKCTGLGISKEKCCFIFEDKSLPECEQTETTTEEQEEDPDKGYAKCVQRGYYAEECCLKYPVATHCTATTTTQKASPDYGLEYEFKRCKSVCDADRRVETCCKLFDFADELKECAY